MHVFIMGVSIMYIAMVHVLPMHVSMLGGYPERFRERLLQGNSRRRIRNLKFTEKGWFIIIEVPVPEH